MPGSFDVSRERKGRRVINLIINLGIGGSILTMIKFSKYCRLLNQRRTLDNETAERYQAKARRCLIMTGILLGAAFAAMFLSAILGI